ncbi:MAG TPA: hypothetical protein VHG91_17140 [Longimicrobium sp.]|nr:hypothetical protein [Longimicrobium sp.]
MHAGTSSDTALRRALLLDAAATVAMGLLLAVAAGSLAGLLGLPAGLLRWAGLFLVPFAAVLALVAKRPTVSGRATVILIACNVLWAVDSFVLLASGWVAPTALGVAFVAAQGLAVAAFAALEYAGLRRAAALA